LGNTAIEQVSERAIFARNLSVVLVSLLTRDPSGIAEYEVGHAELLKHALQSNLVEPQVVVF
jgi:hypothetical protein